MDLFAQLDFEHGIDVVESAHYLPIECNHQFVFSFCYASDICFFLFLAVGCHFLSMNQTRLVIISLLCVNAIDVIVAGFRSRSHDAYALWSVNI